MLRPTALPEEYTGSTMTTRRQFLTAAAAAPLVAQERFDARPGLQMYSLRREAAKDLAATLALVRRWGFEEIEGGGLFGLTVAEYRKRLDDHGLRLVSMMAEWPQLAKSVEEAAEKAHALGARYVVTTNIPNRRPFTMEVVERAVENFNRWGESLARSGLRYCYHPHGFEFGPGPDGTLFDTMARRIDPKNVAFEMDVFWIVHGNQDPAALLAKYSWRFPLMHLKDMRKGEPRTGEPGNVREEASVPLGEGEIDWPPVLRAARQHGVRHYFIEEEHPEAVAQIPRTLAYLKKVTL
jgi:sugar phosphate isomerase/epimerase